VAGRRVIFIGASVGKAWRLPLVFPNIQMLDIYQFDKTPLVEQAIAARPDGVIIKECAAYFPEPGPGEAGSYEEQVRGWVARLGEAGVRVALATVVPVTREHARDQPGRGSGILAFNHWLRGLANDQQIPLLDLEAALCRGPEDRHLDERWHSGDGLHLSKEAYRRTLDALIPPLLLRLFVDP